MSAGLAEFAEPCLERVAVRAVVVTQDDEADSRLPPGPELARNALLQILLAFVRHAQEVQSGKQSRQEPVEQHLHRGLLEQEDDPAHRSPPPRRALLPEGTGQVAFVDEVA